MTAFFKTFRGSSAEDKIKEAEGPRRTLWGCHCKSRTFKIVKDTNGETVVECANCERRQNLTVEETRRK